MHARVCEYVLHAMLLRVPLLPRAISDIATDSLLKHACSGAMMKVKSSADQHERPCITAGLTSWQTW